MTTLMSKLFAITLLTATCLYSTDVAHAGDGIRMEGTSTYSFQSSSQIQIKLDKLTNYRSERNSGTIKIQLWATRTRYKGGRIKGFVFAEVVIGQVNGRTRIHNIKRVAKFRRPPAGLYHVTMVVAEHGFGTYKTVSWRNFPKVLRIRKRPSY